MKTQTFMNRIKGSLMDLLQEDLAKAYDIFIDMDGQRAKAMPKK